MMKIVSAYLENNHITDYGIICHDKVKTMNDVYQIISFAPQQMIKAVLLKIKSDNISYYLLGIPANRLVDLKKVARILGVSRAKIQLASAVEMKEKMNFDPGEIMPFSLNPHVVPFILDTSFSECHSYLYCGAGTHYHTLKIKWSDLKRLPGFQENEISIQPSG